MAIAMLILVLAGFSAGASSSIDDGVYEDASKHEKKPKKWKKNDVRFGRMGRYLRRWFDMQTSWRVRVQME